VLRVRVAEKTQDGFAQGGGDMHRAAVAADHVVRERQRCRQIPEFVRRIGRQRQFPGIVHDCLRLGVVARMLRVISRAGRPEQDKIRLLA